MMLLQSMTRPVDEGADTDMKSEGEKKMGLEMSWEGGGGCSRQENVEKASKKWGFFSSSSQSDYFSTVPTMKTVVQ